MLSGDRTRGSKGRRVVWTKLLRTTGQLYVCDARNRRLDKHAHSPEALDSDVGTIESNELLIVSKKMVDAANGFWRDAKPRPCPSVSFTNMYFRGICQH